MIFIRASVIELNRAHRSQRSQEIKNKSEWEIKDKRINCHFKSIFLIFMILLAVECVHMTWYRCTHTVLRFFYFCSSRVFLSSPKTASCWTTEKVNKKKNICFWLWICFTFCSHRQCWDGGLFSDLKIYLDCDSSTVLCQLKTINVRLSTRSSNFNNKVFHAHNANSLWTHRFHCGLPSREKKSAHKTCK